MKKPKIYAYVLILSALILSLPFYLKTTHSNQTPISSENSLIEGKKIKISDNYYMTYSFSEKPKVGTTMLKVSLFDNNENKISSPKIIGNYDMPSMRDHHPSGEVVFSANKNNDYILPVHFVMRGGWEIIFKIIEEESEIYVGQIFVNI